MSHDPFALLAAALQTERPELLQMFKSQLQATLDPVETAETKVIGLLVQTIENLFTEVYDLRRTCRTMEEANKHIYQALNGCQKHLDVSREVFGRGVVGNLPDHHGAAEIMGAIKAELKAEERGDTEDGG